MDLAPSTSVSWSQVHDHITLKASLSLLKPPCHLCLPRLIYSAPNSLCPNSETELSPLLHLCLNLLTGTGCSVGNCSALSSHFLSSFFSRQGLTTEWSSASGTFWQTTDVKTLLVLRLFQCRCLDEEDSFLFAMEDEFR